MRRLLAVALLLPLPALALTPAAEEFLRITQQLEPVQCEKRKLRRALVLAEVDGRAAEAKRVRARIAELNADPVTAKLERRLAVLEARVLDGQGRPRHPEDLDAISLQQREAFYRCE